MAQNFLLIDGYNLMHAAGLARERYGPGDLDRCRQQLLVWLKTHLADSLHARTTVVFDAIDSPKAEATIERFHNFIVRFPRRGKEADELIEKLIRQHSAPKQILVVSSDHRLHKAVRKRKGRAIDSEEFFHFVSAETTYANHQNNQVSFPESEKPKTVPPGEHEEWLDAFGDISVDEIAAEIKAESPKAVSPDPMLAEPETGSQQESIQPSNSKQVAEEDAFLDEVSRGIDDVIQEENRGDYSDEISMWERRIAELSDDND